MTERYKGKPSVEKEPLPGKLIAVYGINNIGKSTQVSMLMSALAAEGCSVERRKSPGYERASGEVINAILREGREAQPQELQQWQAINMHQEQSSLYRALGEGKIVVTEDYWGTTLAWGLGHGLSREDLDAMISELRVPDIAVLMHGNRFTEAIESGHLHEENDDLTTRVQAHHLELAREFGWHIVDANQSKADVHSQIMSLVSEKVYVGEH